MKLYSVYFIDHKDGYCNHKLLNAKSEGEVRDYMESLGDTIIEIESREE